MVTRREFHAISVQSLVALLAAQASGQEGHDPREAFDKPQIKGEKAPVSKALPGKCVYRMYPLPNGQCAVRGKDAFAGATGDELYTYQLYAWLILGGDKPILLDAGLVHVDQMNEGAKKVLAKPIVQKPGETIPEQIAHFGLKPEDIGHILITHMHFDHIDGVEQFPNAKIHINRKEWELCTADGWRHAWCDARILGYLQDKDRKNLVLFDDNEEILSGIKAIWTGGHTPGSTAYQVNTEYGRVVHTGDVCSLLANYTRKVPAGVYSSLDEAKAAIPRLAKEADYVLASHEPSNPYQWPPRPEGSPRYRIRALKCGECQVRDYITFYDSKSEDTRTYYLYVFVVEGGAKPIVIETGPKDIASFNKGVEKYIPGGLKQKPDERTPVLLKANGIDPADVSHVFVTHLHADHCEYFDAFPNAQLVVNKPGFLSQLRKVKPWVMEALAKRWPDSLRLVEDEQVLPGIRTMYLDCHSPASQGIVVDTLYGPIVFTGDVAYLYENIETDRHTACPDVEACREAIAKIRHASDLFVPAHDPRLLQRWPEGKIAFPSQESPKQAVT